MTAGPIVAGLGLLLMLRVGQSAEYLTEVLPAILVFGLGLAATVAPLTATVLDSVEERRVGIASGVNNGVSRVAGLLAIAVLGAVISAHFGARLDSELGSRPVVGAAAASGGSEGAGAAARAPGAATNASPGAAANAIAEAKEQPLGVPDTSKVAPPEARVIVAASTDASTSAFHLGALLAGLLMILGGIAAGVGIRNPRRRVAGTGEGGDAAAAGGGNAEGGEKLGLAAHG
jgi:hypothetical protein